MASAPKKARFKDTVGNSTVDSTEPTSKLIEYFSNTNRAAMSVYRKLTASRNESLNTQYSHYLIPGHPLNTFSEEWDGVLPSQYFERFTYKSSKPIIMTRMQNIGFKDPVTRLLKEKHDWNAEVQNVIHGVKGANLQEKVERLNDKVVECPQHLIKVAVKLEMDPEPNFNAQYNWYYAGNGNMQVLAVKGIDCVLHSEFSRVYLSKLSRSTLKVKSKHIAMYDCKENRNILETICNVNSFIAVRLKYYFLILKITTINEEIVIQKLKEIESKIPCTSINFDPKHKNVLYVTKLDSSISIVNLDIMKVQNLKLCAPESLVDNWGTVTGCDENSYCHVARKEVTIYDKRCNSKVQSWSEPANVSDNICNVFSVCKKCEDSNLMYLGTNHHLFLMDLRFTNNRKMGMLQRWTHQMQCPPTYMAMTKFEFNKDLICLGSQFVDDTCVIVNDSDAFDRTSYSKSISFPLRLPTFESTLNMARNRMLCVDIYNRIEPRVYTSLTGNAIGEADENYLIFVQNSLGDIFTYNLYPEHIECDDVPGLQRLHEWSNNKSDTQTYECSGVVDIANLWKDLKRVPREHKFGGYKLTPEENEKFSEQEIFDTFQKGELDGALMEVWGLGDNTPELSQTSLTIDLHFSDDSE